MKNLYVRNTMICAAVHLACMYVLIAFSLSSCRASRRPPKDLAFFVDFHPGAPGALVSQPEGVKLETELAKPAIPEPVPEPPKPVKKKSTQTKPAKKPKIEVNTNIIRRAAAPVVAKPVKKLSAAQIRSMLGKAVASVDAPAAGFSTYGTGSGTGSGEATPYGWYLAQVRAAMYEAWQQPSALAGKRGLVTRVVVRVRRDGLIVEKKMLATSGNGLMDSSVMKAVEAVNMLPELPFGFGDASKDITIDFELEDTGP